MTAAAALPVLDLPGVRLRRLRLEDAQAWAAYALLPTVARDRSSDAASVHDLAALIERSLARDPAASVYFALVAAHGTQLLGTVGFHGVNPLHHSAEISYDVHPDHWGRGLASAACEAAVRWGFAECGWHRIQATVLDSNGASQRVLRRCGFTLEGTLRALRHVRGRARDHLLFSRLATDTVPAPDAAADTAAYSRASSASQPG